MMNLLARILSHGFALAVVVLIAIALMYRGDLFPEWELPELLVVEDKSSTGTDGPPAAVDAALPETVASGPESATGVLVEAPQVEALQVEAPQVEAPQVEAPQVEVPQVETPQVETPQVEAPQVETPQVEVPQVEAPQVEVIEEVVTQDVVSPVEVLVPDPVDASPEISHETAAGEDEVAVPSATVTESEVAAEQFEPPLPDMVPSTPALELATDLQPESVAAPATATVTESEVVTEQFESPLPDMVPPTPAPEPATDLQPESVAAPATATVTASEAVTEQPESPAPDVTPPLSATEQVTDSEPDSTVAEAPAAALESNAGKSAYESLAAAREAYWLRDYAGAEDHYRRLIDLEPDNPDWHGELGNMYFAQGQWEQAAVAYYEAGVRLLNDGMVAQARKMVNVIRGLNGAQADDLETQINTVDQVTQ